MDNIFCDDTFVVDDEGIHQIIETVNDNIRITKTIMSKEAFIFAYNEYIKKEGVSSEQTSSEKEKKETSSESQ